MDMQQQQPTQQPVPAGSSIDERFAEYYERRRHTMELWLIANDPDADLVTRRVAYEAYSRLITAVFVDTARIHIPLFDMKLIEDRAWDEAWDAHQLAKSEGRTTLQMSDGRV